MGFSSEYSLFHCLECGIHGCNQVFDFLDTDGKADGIGFDALIQKLFFSALAVGGGGRMDHQRFYICHVCQQREDCQVINEFLCGFASPLISKVKMEPAPFGK